MKNEITKDVLCKASIEVEKLLISYREKINKAFSDELSVSISLPVKIDMGEGKIVIRSGINFIESRVKDESIISIDPNQKQLFPEE
jgi:hypothetical protein